MYYIPSFRRKKLFFSFLGNLKAKIIFQKVINDLIATTEVNCTLEKNHKQIQSQTKADLRNVVTALRYRTKKDQLHIGSYHPNGGHFNQYLEWKHTKFHHSQNIWMELVNTVGLMTEAWPYKREVQGPDESDWYAIFTTVPWDFILPQYYITLGKWRAVYPSLHHLEEKTTAKKPWHTHSVLAKARVGELPTWANSCLLLLKRIWLIQKLVTAPHHVFILQQNQNITSIFQVAAHSQTLYYSCLLKLIYARTGFLLKSNYV